MEYLNLLLQILIILFLALSLRYSINTFKLTFKKPIIEFKLALDDSIKYDPAKNPPNERYLRVIITNPSIVNIGIKLVISLMESYVDSFDSL